MMRKVEIDEPGDTRFLEQQVVDKQEFMEENDRIWGKKVVVDSGDSQNLQPGQIVTARKLRDENSMLKRRDLKPVEVRDAIPATSTQILQGITRLIDFYLTHHLTNNNLKVFVVNLHTLQTVNVLHFIYDIFLYSRGTFNGQNVSRSNRTVR